MFFISKVIIQLKKLQKRIGFFLFSSGITTGLSWICYYKALQLGEASIVVPIDKLSIIVTIIFSYFVLKESLSKKAVAGLILIVAGTMLLLI
ncbi:MAG: EamA family transporter [Thomasclavelia ramosa]